MTGELAKVYDPKSVEGAVSERWLAAGAFDAEADDGRAKYCIVIPPPNVTAPLHLGHALNNTLQDVLIRYKRMCQHNTLWMPGTDHAGIATQTVVEKRILAEEGRRRSDFERGEFVARIQAWKDEYEARIIEQLRLMGCSCDWRRTRFTMDDVCAAAVRAAFFKLFCDGLIYRGKRLVNWDPATQTVLADDEVEHETAQGHFWYMRYPLAEPVVIPSVAGVRRGTGVPPVRPTGVSPVDMESVDKRRGAYLPHWTAPGAKYAVTFRLADSLPEQVLQNYRTEREEIFQRAQRQGRQLTRHEKRELDRLYSDRIQAYLDAGHGACYLKDERIAQTVVNALRHFDGERYDMIAWCVMPNHVHVVVRPLEDHKLSDILHYWKSFTAKKANKFLRRQGQFWQEEYYDHLIRDEEDFINAMNYLLGNPSKAGLTNWPWVGWRRLPQHGQDGHETQGQDAPATHGRDAHATVITHVTVATTRPETMLGDTAVAMNPADPRAPALLGKMVRLPLVGRAIPIVADEHVVLPDPDSDDEKARFSTGFLKVTPAHDPDDWEIGQRHGLPVINVMAPDGTISDKHGWEDAAGTDAEAFLGMDRFEAREAIVEWFRTEGLLEEVREYTHEVGHSYRSHVPIEPYLSDQWYIAVKKPIADCRLPIADWIDDHGDLVETNNDITYLKGTDVPVNSLAGFALAPLLDGRLKFTPDRYARTYQAWLENLRDWPISRQLWWGHQIPVWSLRSPHELSQAGRRFARSLARGETPDIGPFIKTVDQSHLQALSIADTLVQENSDRLCLRFRSQPDLTKGGSFDEWEYEDEAYVCLAEDDPEIIEKLEGCGWTRDPDVLDTWFSSSLWPFSTLGWPDETRPEGDPARPNWAEAKAFYPGDLLCTAREIITLWVSRMVMMGQYCAGDIPFEDVFIHAMIQDGQGRKMSKSLGNGIDPLDIIDSHGADAMRFTLVSMTTQTQDVRMPVEEMTLPDGRRANTSPKFDLGRNFCNKLWNASRFAMMNLGGCPAFSQIHPKADLADAWILSRLNATVRDATAALDSFRFNELADTLYHFMWDDLCDWYLEIAKSRINAGQDTPKAVLACCLDVLLRMLQPLCPFISEAIWQRLNEAAAVRGPGDAEAEPLLVSARWPRADAAMINPAAEERFALLADLIRQVRNVRTEHNVPPARKVSATVEAPGDLAALICDNNELLKSQANLGEVAVHREAVEVPDTAAAVAAGGVKLYVLDVIDRQAEIQRLTKRLATLNRGIEAIAAKLGNEQFLSRAPAEVVQRERRRAESLASERAAVEKSLETLRQ